MKNTLLIAFLTVLIFTLKANAEDAVTPSYTNCYGAENCQHNNYYPYYSYGGKRDVYYTITDEKVTVYAPKETGQSANVPQEAFFNAYQGTSKLPNDSKRRVLEIVGNVTEIEANAFKQANGITKIILPDTVTKIGTSAFENMGRLEKIDFLPSSVKAIEDYAFYNSNTSTKHVTDIIIPNSVTTIGNYAFGSYAANYQLNSLVISDNLTTVGKNAFYNLNVKNLTVSADQLNNYLTAGGGFQSYGDINITCTKGDCEGVLQTKGYTGSRFKVSYATQETQLPDGSTAIYKMGKLVGFKGKRIYTIEEASAIAGKTNTIKIRYK